MKKLKGRGIIAAAAGHNRRVLQAEAGASASIDPARTRLNETLQGPVTADEVAQMARDRMRHAGVGKLRKDAVMGVEIIFSLPPGCGIDDRLYFSDCASWAAQNFGGPENILSVDVHRDEAAPHCHVLVLPLIGGRMAGSDLFGNRKRLLAMQQDFHNAVASRFGLRKAPGRLTGPSKQRAAGTVLDRLRTTADAALRSVLWPAVRDAIERDPVPFLTALAIVLDPPKKKLRTMTQIFTSKGKGKSRENPIGFEHSQQMRTLCSVGFAPKHVPSATPTPPPARWPGPQTEITRERERDLDPALYDPESGEFRPAAERTAKVKATAAAWVGGALARRTKADASNDPSALSAKRGKT